MAVNTYDLGDLIRCSGVFTNAAGTAIDPDAVLFQFRTPQGDITSYTYLTDAELVRDSLGNFHVDIDATESGTWWSRFYATGNGQSADELSFIVSDSRF